MEIFPPRPCVVSRCPWAEVENPNNQSVITMNHQVTFITIIFIPNPQLPLPCPYVSFWPLAPLHIFIPITSLVMSIYMLSISRKFLKTLPLSWWVWVAFFYHEHRSLSPLVCRRRSSSPLDRPGSPSLRHLRLPESLGSFWNSAPIWRRRSVSTLKTS